MQFTTSLLLLAAAGTSFVAAADVTSLVAQIPPCAIPCLTKASSDAGCGLIDYQCQCSKSTAIAGSASTCLTTACSAADIASMSKSLCQHAMLITHYAATSNLSTQICRALAPVVPGTTIISTATPVTTGASAATTTAKPNAAGRADAGLVGLVGAMALAAAL